ncbi:MAG TPA: hypothetical protein VFC78_19420 [Tepidisphaeraceae bacterium]|nr:hypothetical protein [Tepidisphaeraceae bacterium]
MHNRLTLAVLSVAVAGVPLTLPSAGFGQVRPPAKLAAPAVDSHAHGQQQAVPIKEVVLYTSGVGYFEHFGTVKGNGDTELHFKADQINDILKSLLLEDLDGGKVAAVTYGSQGPLSRTLKSFQVDLSNSPPLNQLLSQLRGATVTASLPQGQVTGQILSVEKKQKPAADKQMIDVWVVDLLLPAGSIRPVELDQVSEIKLDDPKLQQELVKALGAVAAARDQDQKPVNIRFTGQGERHVRIGYVVEAPVWKASYRLVLTGEKKAAGGGNNPEKTQKTEPIDLSTTLDRPRGQQYVPPGIKRAPANDLAQAITAADGARKSTAGEESAKLQGWAIIENQTDNDWEDVQLSLVSGRPISFIEDLYQPLYVQRPVVEPNLYASLRPQTYAEGIGRYNPVGQSGEKAGLGRELRDAAAASPARLRAGGMGYGAAPAAAMPPAPYNRPMDATASVSSLASGAAVGEFFEYTVGNVSLPRQKSAMIPIVTDSIEARRMSIYNASVLPDHPLLGARLTNTTGKLLPQGPITVLDGGAYAGDANIEDLPSKQTRLISYGIDQQLLVHSNDQTQDSSLVTGKIIKGVLELTYKQIFKQVYEAQNKGKSDRFLLIEHAKRQGWTLEEPAKASETTDTLYRFEESVPAGATKKLAVREDLVNAQRISILPMDTSQIEIYLRSGPIPDDVKKALQQAAKFKYALVDTQRQIQEREQNVNEITQEQNRIRENMKAVAQNTDYYKRLLKELDTQETQIQKLKGETKDLRQKQDQQRKDLENYLANLTVG